MATILPFAARPATTAPRRKGEAVIIIFPGVRYEAVEKADVRRGRRGRVGKCKSAEARGAD